MAEKSSNCHTFPHHKHDANNHFLWPPRQNEEKDENGWQQIIGLIIHQIVHDSIEPSFFIVEFGQLKIFKRFYIKSLIQPTFNSLPENDL